MNRNVPCILFFILVFISCNQEKGKPVINQETTLQRLNNKEKVKSGLEDSKTYALSESPKFIDYENFNGGTTSLNDLKGRYVYIDIWATWCKPCINEIPYLKIMETAYQHKNIVFVSISVDKQKHHDIWEKMVTKYELKGIQLFAKNSFESKFIRDLGINSIPRFVLLDPSGNIINDDAPRPSDKRLILLLDSLDL